MRRVRVAVAGFGPFPGVPKNPSAEIVRTLARKRRFPAAGIELIADVFPTAYVEADTRLQSMIAAKPDAIVLFGVASKTKHIRIETVARNAASTLYPDQARYTPSRRKLMEDGVARLNTRSPRTRLLAAARTSGAKAEFSIDAGRYLCNAVFYRALAETAALTPPPLVQFVHVPAVAEAGLARLVRAGEAVVWAAAQEAARSRAVSDRDG